MPEEADELERLNEILDKIENIPQPSPRSLSRNLKEEEEAVRQLRRELEEWGNA